MFLNFFFAPKFDKNFFNLFSLDVPKNFLSEKIRTWKNSSLGGPRKLKQTLTDERWKLTVKFCENRNENRWKLCGKVAHDRVDFRPLFDCVCETTTREKKISSENKMLFLSVNKRKATDEKASFNSAQKPESILVGEGGKDGVGKVEPLTELLSRGLQF